MLSSSQPKAPECVQDLRSVGVAQATGAVLPRDHGGGVAPAGVGALEDRSMRSKRIRHSDLIADNGFPSGARR